jgi:hypothetical protein
VSSKYRVDVVYGTPRLVELAPVSLPGGRTGYVHWQDSHWVVSDAPDPRWKDTPGEAVEHALGPVRARQAAELAAYTKLLPTVKCAPPGPGDPPPDPAPGTGPQTHSHERPGLAGEQGAVPGGPSAPVAGPGRD